MTSDRTPSARPVATREASPAAAPEGALPGAPPGASPGALPPAASPADSGRLSPAAFRLLISVILTGGVTISAILIGVGLVTGLIAGYSQSLAGGTTGSAGAADFGALADNLAAIRPIGIAQLGLVVLLATPVVRVGAAVVGFALERDRLYVVVSAVVLGILLASIFLLR